MDMKIALALRNKAEADLRVAEELVKLAASDEQHAYTQLAEIDDEIARLQEQREILEEKILRSKYERDELVAVTIREASMLTGMGEMTLRAYANPKRQNKLDLIKEPGEMVKVTIKSLRQYIR